MLDGQSGMVMLEVHELGILERWRCETAADKTNIKIDGEAMQEDEGVVFACNAVESCSVRPLWSVDVPLYCGSD